MASEYMYWHDLRGLPIIIAKQGREAGVVDDFYYEPGTQAINALRVDTGLPGYRILLASAISSIDSAGVTVANESMLIDEANAGPIYQLPRGQNIPGFTITTEQGRTQGAVRNVILGIYPPVALRIAAFELDDRRRSRISAQEVIGFGEGILTVMG